MTHRLLFVDAETFYDDQYSLKKMPPPNYILDPRFELIMCAAAWDNEPSFLVDGPDFADFLRSVDPATTTVVAFNALFDLAILAWRYRWVAARSLCSMRIAAALRGHLLPSVSLASVSKCLGVGVKGTEIENVKGMHRADIIASGRWHRFTQYALNDNELQRKIFFALAPEFPVSERKIMDRVIRCAIQPEFHVDKALLAQHLVDMAKEKDRLLREAGVTDPSDLRSTPKFEAILKARGVEIEYKPTAAGTTPAFAKTDEFMAKLAEHDDPVVQALAAARLSLRSTIEERRSERILSIANLDWSCYRDGNPPLMPIPLRYSGAHTHRLSGDWLLNMQNLPTGRNGTPTKLRKAIKAPPGHKVLVADLAQIECRINGWLCGQWDLLDVFAKGLDPYAILASGVFGYEIDKNVHKLERFIGKSGVLGLGFRCGASKFYNMVIRSARAMNMDMGPLLNIWTENLAQKTVDTYRAQNRQIYNTWYRLDEILESAWVGKGDPVRFGPTVIGEGYVHLPSDLKMNYAVENRDLAQGDLTYRYGKVLHKIHGGVLLENIVQALARIVLMNAALRLWDRHLPFKLQAHDELGFILPDAAVWRDAKGKPAGPAVEILKRELKRPPSWAPNLPLDCEIGFGESYGDAK